MGYHEAKPKNKRSHLAVLAIFLAVLCAICIRGIIVEMELREKLAGCEAMNDGLARSLGL